MTTNARDAEKQTGTTTSQQSDWVEDIRRLDPDKHTQLTQLMGGYFASTKISPKLIHLIWIAVDSVVTHLFPYGTDLHVTAALGHGATKEELLETLSIASTVTDRSLNAALPILLEEADAAKVSRPDTSRPLSHAQEELKARLVEQNGFSPKWLDQALRVSPHFATTLIALGYAPDQAKALDPKSRTLIFLALYSCPALLDEALIRQHARRAYALGATAEELFEVAQLANGIGLHAFTAGMPFVASAVAAQAAGLSRALHSAFSSAENA